ncbi:unnamed protein product [Prunus armeniaca]
MDLGLFDSLGLSPGEVCWVINEGLWIGEGGEKEEKGGCAVVLPILQNLNMYYLPFLSPPPTIPLHPPLLISTIPSSPLYFDVVHLLSTIGPRWFSIIALRSSVPLLPLSSLFLNEDAITMQFALVSWTMRTSMLVACSPPFSVRIFATS